MNVLQKMVFIGEIALQAKIAQRADERLQATHDNFDRLETWCSIQSILIAAANVSKILWPNPKYNMHGEKLREMLNVEIDNPLSQRKFRNHFEHYDERIEEWFAENPDNTVYRDLAMNPSLPGNITMSNNHRAYNAFNNTVIFRGETLELNEVLDALKKILDTCKHYTLV